MRRFSLYRRGRIWYGQLYNSKTRRYTSGRSTGESSRNEASRVVAKWLFDGIPKPWSKKRRAAGETLEVDSILTGIRNAALYGTDAEKRLVRLLGLPFRLYSNDFAGWSDDTITRMGVHATTHMDAPWHYGPTDAHGRRPQAIHEMPLDLCFGPGVIFDMRHKSDGSSIAVYDLERNLAQTGAILTEGTIALILTGRDKLLLRGLDQLPSHGFDVAVFPLRLKNASAEPVRAVAFLHD
jgi:hypothetical protein